MIALESKRVHDSLHILHLVFTPITLIVWMACDTCYTVYSYAYIYMVYFLYRTFTNLKTQFSETTCLIAMKLIHDIKRGM